MKAFLRDIWASFATILQSDFWIFFFSNFDLDYIGKWKIKLAKFFLLADPKSGEIN